MKRVLLAILLIPFSFMGYVYSQENVSRCKQENNYIIMYWLGNTDPSLIETTKNYFDGNNNVVISLTTSFEDLVESMSSRSEYQYYDDGELKSETIYNWRENIGDWYKSTTINYLYENGKIMKMEKTSYLSGKPVLESYTTYSYDGEGQLIKESINSLDFGTEEFHITEQITYTDFITFNKPQKSYRESLDYGNMQLFVSAKTETVYNEDFEPISKLSMTKDYDTENAFIDESKEEWTYQNGLNIEYMKSIVDFETSEFVFSEKRIMEYNAVTKELESIETFSYDLWASIPGWNRSAVYECYYSDSYNENHAPKNLVGSVVTGSVNTVKLTWDNPSNITDLKGFYILRDCVVINPDEPFVGNEYIDSAIMNGDHSYIVQAIYENNDANISNVVYVSVFDPSCIPPTDFKVTALSYNENMMEYTVSLSWIAPVSENNVIGYNVYKDGNKVNFKPITKLVYDDKSYEEGVFEYQIAAVYTTGNSPLSEPIEVTLNPDVVGIETMTSQSGNMSIYPNPAIDKVYFSNAVNSVQIYDMSGNLVITLDEEIYSLGVERLMKGVYIVVTIDSTGRRDVNRLIIK